MTDDMKHANYEAVGKRLADCVIHVALNDREGGYLPRIDYEAGKYLIGWVGGGCWLDEVPRYTAGHLDEVADDLRKEVEYWKTYAKARDDELATAHQELEAHRSVAGKEVSKAVKQLNDYRAEDQKAERNVRGQMKNHLREVRYSQLDIAKSLDAALDSNDPLLLRRQCDEIREKIWAANNYVDPRDL